MIVIPDEIISTLLGIPTGEKNQIFKYSRKNDVILIH